MTHMRDEEFLTGAPGRKFRDLQIQKNRIWGPNGPKRDPKKFKSTSELWPVSTKLASTANLISINAMSQMVSAGAKVNQKGPSIGATNPVAAAPLKVSDYLLASISITKGGETHLDIV